MIFKKLERYSPRFHNSELGKKIKGTPSIFSPGCKDFVLQYVDKAQNFEKRDIFASWQFLFNISDMFYANNDIPLIYFFQFSSYSLAPMPSSTNILVMVTKIVAVVKKHLFLSKRFCHHQKFFLLLLKKVFVIVQKIFCHCQNNFNHCQTIFLFLSKEFFVIVKNFFCHCQKFFCHC